MTQIYVEFVGLPGVGKSTVVERLVTLLRESHQVIVSGEPPPWRVLLQPRAWPRLSRFIRLVAYLRFARAAELQRAIRRARVVLLSGQRQDYTHASDGALVLDEGPIVYLTNVGGYGPRWTSWASYLLPHDSSVRVVLVFLQLDDGERRRRLVGRGSAAEPDPTDGRAEGKTGITVANRAEGYAFWLDCLQRSGVDCLSIELAGRSAHDVALAIREHIMKGHPDMTHAVADSAARMAST